MLAALRQRDETGEGQHVEVSLLASALSGLVNQSGAYAAAGVVPHRMGNAHPSVYPYQAMPTKDRDVIIAAANDRQFRSLCEVLGIAEVADDPRFRLNADRTANRAELHPLLLEKLRQWSADDLFLALNRAGRAVRSDQLDRRGRATRRTARPRPDRRRRRRDRRDPQPDHVRQRASCATTRPPPTLGEHSDEIRRWLSDPPPTV